MRTAHAVIGAGWGDEGKGATVDRRAAALGGGCVVVRHNGGAQAGHTVVAPDRRRHVFGHVGAGAFAGAPTLLSRHFACHPGVFVKERAVLGALGVDPVVWVEPGAALTTPWEMAINRAVEHRRGRERHGSCGLGVGETAAREEAGVTLRVADLDDEARVRAVLDRIGREWVPARAAALGLSTGGWYEEVDPEPWLEDAMALREAVEVRTIVEAAGEGPLVFEGAQGLGLDMCRGAWPHVTRSRTGVANAVLLAREAGVERLDVTWVTRAYATRHGAGPLPEEQRGLSVPDETNVEGEWQGAMRVGVLRSGDLIGRIVADRADGGGLLGAETLAVTCLDHLDALRVDTPAFRSAGETRSWIPGVARAAGCGQWELAAGAARGDVLA